MKRAGHVRLFELEAHGRPGPARVLSPTGPAENAPTKINSHAANVAPMIDPRVGRTQTPARDAHTSRSDVEHTKRDPDSARDRPDGRPRGLPDGPRPDGPGRRAQQPAESAGSMKPYVETIPGTDVKFEMVPIPGGTFEMGSPPIRGQARRGRGPAASGPDRAVLDGQVRGHLGRIRPVRLLARPQEEGAREGRPDQAARDREEVRRRHPADPALCRRDLRLRPQRPAGDLHHPPRGDGILPVAVGQDRQDLSPAHRGRVGIRLPRRHQDRLFLGRRARQARRVRLGRRQRREAREGRQEEAESLGPARHPRQRRRVVPRPLQRRRLQGLLDREGRPPAR